MKPEVLGPSLMLLVSLCMFSLCRLKIVSRMKILAVYVLMEIVMDDPDSMHGRDVEFCGA